MPINMSNSTPAAPTGSVNVAFQTDGSNVSAYYPHPVASFNFFIDGGGFVPATGAYGQVTVPANCTITGWVLTANATGSAVVDVLYSTYGNFPAGPTSIAGSDQPTLSSAIGAEDFTLSGWGSTSLAGQDSQLQIKLVSITTCTRLNLAILVTVP